MVKPWATETDCRKQTWEWLLSHPEIHHAGLSQEAVEGLYEMSKQHIPYERASWDETFLQIASDAARRSPDSQTQVGAVIVSTDKHIKGVGYNGWMPHINDDLIPNIRPGKHNWVLHAELNAVLNCEHRPQGCSIYCTHQPCIPCFQICVAAGIVEVVYTTNSSTTNTDGKNIDWEIAKFLVRDRVTVREINSAPWNG